MARHRKYPLTCEAFLSETRAALEFLRAEHPEEFPHALQGLGSLVARLERHAGVHAAGNSTPTQLPADRASK